MGLWNTNVSPWPASLNRAELGTHLKRAASAPGTKTPSHRMSEQDGTTFLGSIAPAVSNHDHLSRCLVWTNRARLPLFRLSCSSTRRLVAIRRASCSLPRS